jgi:GNAT superfamily N-acetyltransferase
MRDDIPTGGTTVVVLRPRHPDDLPECVAALAEVHRQDGYPSRWPVRPAASLSPAGLLEAWVAVAEGVVVGHVTLAPDAEVADINVITAAGWPTAELASVSRLFVRPAMQGAGIGQRLLEMATAFAAEYGIGLAC